MVWACRGDSGVEQLTVWSVQCAPQHCVVCKGLLALCRVPSVHVVVFVHLSGEGIALVGDRVIMLTWKEHIGLVYDVHTFELMDTFRFSTTRNEGWGIAYDDVTNELAVSDGSSVIHFWDPDTLQETRRITVLDDNNRVVTMLNELEFVDGELFANVWYSNAIVRINPSTGRVIGVLDFGALRPKRERGEDVFNGIAWDAVKRELCVAPFRDLCCGLVVELTVADGGSLQVCHWQALAKNVGGVGGHKHTLYCVSCAAP